MLCKKRLIFCLIVLVYLISRPLSAAAEGEASRYFPVTGHYVRGDFLRFFDAHGGLEVFGYPRTEQFVENGRSVQYFQRQRMEFWPENPEPYKVQLMLIGDVVLGPGEPPIPSDAIPSPDDAARRYYPETGHTISGDFKDFFDGHGGLDVFGYPVAEPEKQGSVLIQRFQRARFEQWESGLITLGLLGDRYIFEMGGVPAALTAPQPAPGASTDQTATSVASSVPATNVAGKIIFQKSNGGPMYAVNPDGSGLAQVGVGMDPSLSPDGRRLVYVSWGYPEGIYVLNLENGESGLLFAAHEARSPIWSPDGGKIAFYVKTQGYRRGMFGRIEPEDFFNIIVLDLATGKTSNPPDQPKHSFSPSWSPDGNRLVFKGDSGLYLASNDAVARIDGTDTRFAFPVWSPDGRSIAFMYRQHDHWEIGSINVDGSGFRLLTSSLPFATPANNVSPAWSPDGSKIAFASDRDGAWKIYTMNADGSNQRKLTDETVDYEWAMERVVYWGKD